MSYPKCISSHHFSLAISVITSHLKTQFRYSRLISPLPNHLQPIHVAFPTDAPEVALFFYLYHSLNIKCPPQAYVFKHSVASK